MENNKQERNYIEILKNSMDRKEQVLEKILLANEEQKQVALEPKFDYDKFDQIYEEKGKLISELNLLDSGFQSIYDRVSETLANGREQYKDDIIKLQESIRKFTQLSMEIEASEKRNKELMEKTVSNLKNDVKVAKATSKAAVGYYNNMSRLTVIEPQFMDKKK